MAFNSSNFINSGLIPGSFNPVNSAGNSILPVTGYLWNYTTSDTISDISKNDTGSDVGYFNTAPARPGDLIFVTASDGYVVYAVRQVNPPGLQVFTYKLVQFAGVSPVVWIS